MALGCSGRYAKAAAVAEQALAMSGRHTWALATYVTIYTAWGRPDVARAAYEEMVARSATTYVQPTMLALAAAYALGIDEGIAFLRRAVDVMDVLVVTNVRSWPLFERLRADPRFAEIVRPLNLP